MKALLKPRVSLVDQNSDWHLADLDALHRLVALTAKQGDPVPCTGPSRDDWTSDHLPTQRKAALACTGCPLLEECCDVGAVERGGVWGGELR